MEQTYRPLTLPYFGQLTQQLPGNVPNFGALPAAQNGMQAMNLLPEIPVYVPPPMGPGFPPNTGFPPVPGGCPTNLMAENQYLRADAERRREIESRDAKKIRGLEDRLQKAEIENANYRNMAYGYGPTGLGAGGLPQTNPFSQTPSPLTPAPPAPINKEEAIPGPVVATGMQYQQQMMIHQVQQQQVLAATQLPITFSGNPYHHHALGQQLFEYQQPQFLVQQVLGQQEADAPKSPKTPENAVVALKRKRPEAPNVYKAGIEWRRREHLRREVLKNDAPKSPRTPKNAVVTLKRKRPKTPNVYKAGIGRRRREHLRREALINELVRREHLRREVLKNAFNVWKMRRNSQMGTQLIAAGKGYHYAETPRNVTGEELVNGSCSNCARNSQGKGGMQQQSEPPILHCLQIFSEHNFLGVKDTARLKATCTLARKTLSNEYLYRKLLRIVQKVSFAVPKGSEYSSMVRWYRKRFSWIEFKDSTNVWLARSVDPNPVGRHDKPIYTFGGQTVSENRYSNVLSKITMTTGANGLRLSREIIEPQRDDISTFYPCGRAACGVSYVDNKLFLFGGRGFAAYLNDVWSWDPSKSGTNSWHKYASRANQAVPHVRWAHCMVSYGTGFLTFGGSAPGHLFDDLWSFNRHDGWMRLHVTGRQPSKRAGHAGLFLNGYFYIFGGNTAGPEVETYNDCWRVKLDVTEDGNPNVQGNHHPVAPGSWEKMEFTGDKLTPRIGHSIVALSNDRIMLFGGRDLSFGIREEARFSRDTDIIDLSDKSVKSVRVDVGLRRTGTCVFNHPEGIVFWGGLASDRQTIAPAVLCKPL